MAAEYIIIAIFIIIVAVFIGFHIYKKQYYNNINELKARKKTLLEGVPTQRIETVRTLEISGQSLDYAKRLEEDWRRIQSGKNITVENHLFQAEQSTDRYHFKDAGTHQDKAFEEMQIIEQDLTKLTASLDEVIGREAENKKRMADIQDNYESIRKELLVNSFSYGSAVEQLESRLAEMENEYTAYKELTKSGDHEEARKVIIKLDKLIQTMEKYMKDIPEILDRIEDDFHEQLDEIEKSYEQLSEEGFVFTGTPIHQEIEQIEEKITLLNKLTGELEIETANKAADEIALNIDALYDRMELEIEARQEVYHLLSDVEQAVDFLTEEVRVLFFEIDRVSQSYVLVHNEQNQINELKDKVSAVNIQYEKLQDSLQSRFISFSEAKNVLEELKDRLIDTNDEKEAVTDQLASYRDEEQNLKEDLSRMEHKVREVRRYLERQNLPGIPNDYVEYSHYVTRSLVSLSEELARPKLKVGKIYDLYDICKEEVANLENRTQELVDNAALTELFAQRLYRYRENYPEVLQVINQSESLFNDMFDYDSAATVVRNKLNSIDENAVAEIEEEYSSKR